MLSHCHPTRYRYPGELPEDAWKANNTPVDITVVTVGLERFHFLFHGFIIIISNYLIHFHVFFPDCAVLLVAGITLVTIHTVSHCVACGVYPRDLYSFFKPVLKWKISLKIDLKMCIDSKQMKLAAQRQDFTTANSILNVSPGLCITPQFSFRVYRVDGIQ